MSKIDFLKIFKEAWQISWKYKFLWWFGFFATLGNLGSINYSLNPKEGSEFEKSAALYFQNFVQQHLNLVIIGAILLFLVILFFMILGVIGRGALIKSVQTVVTGKPGNYRSGIKEGKKYFWRLLGLGALLIFSVFASIIILATPIVFLFANKAYAIGVVLSIFAVAIVIPLFILLTFLKEYGILYIVLGDIEIFSAIENAYELFRKNISNSILMALLFIPLGIGLMVTLFLYLVSLVIIFAALGFMAYLALGKIGVIIIAFLGALIFIAGMIFMRSVWEVFVQTAWLLFFHEIATPKAEERASETSEETGKDVLPSTEPVQTAFIDK